MSLTFCVWVFSACSYARASFRLKTDAQHGLNGKKNAVSASLQGALKDIPKHIWNTIGKQIRRLKTALFPVCQRPRLYMHSQRIS